MVKLHRFERGRKIAQKPVWVNVDNVDFVTEEEGGTALYFASTLCLHVVEHVDTVVERMQET